VQGAEYPRGGGHRLPRPDGRCDRGTSASSAGANSGLPKSVRQITALKEKMCKIRDDNHKNERNSHRSLTPTVVRPWLTMKPALAHPPEAPRVASESTEKGVDRQKGENKRKRRRA